MNNLHKLLFASICVCLMASCTNQMVSSPEDTSLKDTILDLNTIVSEQAQEIATLKDLLTTTENELLQSKEPKPDPTRLNPIDQFFINVVSEMPEFYDTTIGMVSQGVWFHAAWYEEVEQLKEMLSEMTSYAVVEETLTDMIAYHRAYTQSRAELVAMMTASNAFENDGDNEAGILFGSNARIVRPMVIAEGERDLALHLLRLVNSIKVAGFSDGQENFSLLIFDEAAFLERIQGNGEQ